MGSARLMYLTAAVLIAALTVSVLMTGCGGDDANPYADTGTVTGQTVDATSGLGLGGVTVQIGNMVGGQFVAAATGLSTTPLGQYEIKGVPVGAYTVLYVIPVAAIGPPNATAINVTVQEGQNVPLGPVLIIDDVPPDPGA